MRQREHCRVECPLFRHQVRDQQAAPLGPDLSVVWKFEEFVATMRTGVDSNGHELNRQMPWRPIGRMGDEELMAIYEFLTHMPRS